MLRKNDLLHKQKPKITMIIIFLYVFKLLDWCNNKTKSYSAHIHNVKDNTFQKLSAVPKPAITYSYNLFFFFSKQNEFVNI